MSLMLFSIKLGASGTASERIRERGGVRERNKQCGWKGRVRKRTSEWPSSSAPITAIIGSLRTMATNCICEKNGRIQFVDGIYTGLYELASGYWYKRCTGANEASSGWDERANQRACELLSLHSMCRLQIISTNRAPAGEVRLGFCVSDGKGKSSIEG